jgi:hypothetical protein
MEKTEKEGGIGRKDGDKNKNIMRYKCRETMGKQEDRERERRKKLKIKVRYTHTKLENTGEEEREVMKEISKMKMKRGCTKRRI